MGENVERIAAIMEPPGLPEAFADGVTIRDAGREVIQIVYTVDRGNAGPEAVVRIWMPRGAFEAARMACERGGPRH